tara:strand:+ start:50 stop:2512 length:2463 start_codon:yes stop_codon:yes gene_type:complete
MAEKKFIIEVRTKGFSRATRDFKSLDKNTKQARKSTQNMRQSTERLRGSFDGMQGTLGSLRNRLLVYSFALGGAAAITNKFVQAASGFEDVKTRLVGLTGSVSAANDAFDRFNAVAAKTPFQLQDVVNAGAQLEAFGLDAKATLRATTDLAAFMGTNAVEAASALGRAFAGGQGAADILRERGILQIIKDSEGIKDLTKLTLPEFRVALINAMADPDGRISGSADRLSQTFSGAVSNMNDSLNRAAAEIGDILLPALKSVVQLVDRFAQSVNKKEIAEFVTVLTAISAAMFVIHINTLRARLAVFLFDKTLTKTKIGLAVTGFALLFDTILELTGAFDDLSQSTNDFNADLEKQEQDLKQYQTQLANVSPEINKVAESIEEHKKASEGITKTLQDELFELRAQKAELEGVNPIIVAMMRARVALTDENRHQIESLITLRKEVKALADAENLREKNIKLTIDKQSELFDLNRLLHVANNANKDTMEESIAVNKRGNDMLNEMAEVLGLTASQTTKFKSTIDPFKVSIKESGDVLKIMNTEMGASKNEAITVTEEQAKAIMVIQKLNLAEMELAEKLKATTEELKKRKEETDAATQAQNDNIKTFQDFFLKTDEGQRNNIQNTIDMIMANRDLLSNFGDVDITLDHLKQKLADVGTQQKQFAESANIAAGALNMTTSAVRALSSESTSTEAKMQALLGILASFIGMVGGPTGMVAGAGLNLFGALAFGHTGGLIKNNGIQKFATGGMVRGQDNVPIMAQAGEFIMQRSAVDNIGIQNLANLNNGTSGVGNNITVNISAPLVDDTVVDHIIPAIEKASRFDRA